jgi:hypothetical protein
LCNAAECLSEVNLAPMDLPRPNPPLISWNLLSLDLAKHIALKFFSGIDGNMADVFGVIQKFSIMCSMKSEDVSDMDWLPYSEKLVLL